MLIVESRVEIRRPVDQLFAYLSEPGNWPQWLDGIVESQQEGNEKFGVGTRVRQVIKFLGRRFDITAQVAEFQPNTQIVMQVVSGPFPMVWAHSLEAIGDGSRLTTTLEADPGTYFRIAGPLLKPVLQRHLDTDHATLKALLNEEVHAQPR